MLGGEIDTDRDVALENLVAHIATPAGGDGAIELAEGRLVEEHTQGVDVGRGAGDPPFENLRRHVETRASGGAALGFGEPLLGDSRGPQALPLQDMTDPEITDPHPGSLVGLEVHQEIGRFDVLVQNTDGVGGGQGLGGLGHQLEALGQRDLGETSLGLGPLDQAAGRGVLGLEEVGGGLEVPVEEVNDIRSLPERVLQQAKEGDLSLQSS